MTLLQKIEDRSAIVGVIGLGYVGLPLLKVFHNAGFATLGFDVDAKKIDMLNKGQNYLKHFGEDFVKEMVASGSFEPTDNFDRLAEADAVLICVPTPVDEHLQPDLSYVEGATNATAKTLREGQLVVLESTTYPGTTREVCLPQLEAGGLKCGKDFYLAFSPEREDPGRKDHSTQTIPKLVGGIDDASGKLATALYSTAIKQVISVSSAEIAEAAKILENTYRAVNIALVNELKRVLTAMNIDIWEVVAAAATKPFGFQAFYPGPGLGGHCIPIDPFYLAWKAREVGVPTRFIELAGEVNRSMPQYVIERTMMALNTIGKAVSGSRILLLGLAYKPNIDDVRESPSFELITLLKDMGAKVDYHDPHVPETHKMRRHDLQMTSIELSNETLRDYDCVLIGTHHDAYDWQMIADNAKLIVDTRGVMRNVDVKQNTVITA